MLSLVKSRFFKNIVVYLIIFLVLFTSVSQIYYIYIHKFDYTRCRYMNNNDKSKCVSKSDMRNFLYNKLLNKSQNIRDTVYVN